MFREVEAYLRTTRGGTRSAASAIAVLLLWLGMWAADLAYVARFGSNVPSWDDWDMVPTMTGVQPITLEWLWSQHNEHRIPVPRLVMLALFRIFGDDFRVKMYFNVLLMAALALGLMYLARRLRGRTTLVDAFFPLVLLNFSHSVSFLWVACVQFTVSTALAGGVLSSCVLGTPSVPGGPGQRLAPPPPARRERFPWCCAGAGDRMLAGILRAGPDALGRAQRKEGGLADRGHGPVCDCDGGALLRGLTAVPYHPSSGIRLGLCIRASSS